MPKILKFGGTSVGTASSIKQVLSIAKTSPKGSVAVFSAFSKVTDLIAEASDLAANNLNKSLELITAIESRTYELIRQIIADSKISVDAEKYAATQIAELRELMRSMNFLSECSGTAIDSALAKGELLSSSLIHYALLDIGIKSFLADARDFIVTDSNHCKAMPQFDLITEKIRIELIEPLSQHDYHIAVTQGFIGRSTKGKTTTLGRGGSDYSASIIGSCMKRNSYPIDSIDIYTDVDGVMSADPKSISNARSLDTVSVAEMLEMSYYGAKVLHPKTILPALDAQIQVSVLNTFNPNFSGTHIENVAENKRVGFHSIIKLNDLFIFRIFSDNIHVCAEELRILNLRINSTNSTVIYNSVIAYNAIVIAMISDKTDLMILQTNGNVPEPVFGYALTGENLRLEDAIRKVTAIYHNTHMVPDLNFYPSPTRNSIILCSDKELDIQKIHDSLIIQASVQ